ncbi:hypothetical protein [Cytobacillus oceanisediminis]|nr:hypothetical protein [Cytobacillus oceanisediminis]
MKQRNKLCIKGQQEMDGDLKIKLECLSIAWAAGNTIAWPIMYVLSGYLPSGISLGCIAFIWYTVLKYNQTAKELWGKWTKK